MWKSNPSLALVKHSSSKFPIYMHSIIQFTGTTLYLDFFSAFKQPTHKYGIFGES